MNKHANISLIALVVALGCGQPAPDDGSASHPNAAGAAAQSATPTGSSAQGGTASDKPLVALAHDDKWEAMEEEEVPAEKFTGGARAFGAVKDAILSSYYSDAVSEDDLYRAATQGMLEHMDPRMKKWNKLLTPHEMAEVKNDLKGEIVGVGAQIKFDATTGYINVLGTIPGSAAERAGLLPGDTIVRVNDKLYKGAKLREVTGDIRGKAGETVTLSVLREGRLQPIAITRELIAYDQVNHTVFASNVGYVRIPSFTEKTVAGVKTALTELAQKSVTGLVLDMRQNQGGLFEEAVRTAELLVPAGSEIVALKKRNKPEEKFLSKGTPILADVPVVVIVDHGTASGAELISGALRDDRHARLVGMRTLGKWSVQMMDDLPNGYAYKYTLSLLYAPGGKTFEGVGLEPDVEVNVEDAQRAKAASLGTQEARLAADVQLRTAVELLKK